MLATVLATGCAGTRPYYSDTFSDSPTILESDRSWMVIYLDEVIRSQRVKQITMVTPENGEQSLYPRDDSSPPTIDWLPLPVLFAARYILNPRRKGVEADLLVHTEADEYTPVTALRESDGSVRIEMGPTLKSLLPPPERQPTREEIVQRFGVSAVRDGASRWKPLDLVALEQALALLSPQERALIRDVSFIRSQKEATASRKSSAKILWGRYRGNIRETKGRQIELFDTIPGADTSRFIGDPQHPYPVTTLCLLHEIGHAIADYARMKTFHRWSEWLAAALPLIRERKSAAGQLTKERAAELDQRLAALEAEREALEQRYTALTEQYKRELGPVLAAYREARGPEKGPTPYGRTDLKESFAESFALYKADPEALRRVYPELHEWFATGHHIKALSDALGEDLAPLNQQLGQSPNPQAALN